VPTSRATLTEAEIERIKELARAQLEMVREAEPHDEHAA
jgi:hypothetical protein